MFFQAQHGPKPVFGTLLVELTTLPQLLSGMMGEGIGWEGDTPPRSFLSLLTHWASSSRRLGASLPTTRPSIATFVRSVSLKSRRIYCQPIRCKANWAETLTRW